MGRPTLRCGSLEIAGILGHRRALLPLSALISRLCSFLEEPSPYEMDRHSPMTTPLPSLSSIVPTPSLPEVDRPFVGQWNQLVSTTNWEKGRIIHEWREATLAAGGAEYSDETWSSLVGGVTSQHVGRLRRVYHRFAASQSRYPGLYWSHFQAAIDWEDAEMWLEGAAQNDWSVATMRRTRWETLGAIPAEQPADTDLITAETDEDFVATPADSGETAAHSHYDSEPRPEGPDFGDEPEAAAGDTDHTEYGVGDDQAQAIATVRPFENLAELPQDLADAFDAFKLAILRHKTDNWQQIKLADVLASLDSLKELAVAP